MYHPPVQGLKAHSSTLLETNRTKGPNACAIFVFLSPQWSWHCPCQRISSCTSLAIRLAQHFCRRDREREKVPLWPLRRIDRVIYSASIPPTATNKSPSMPAAIGVWWDIPKQRGQSTYESTKIKSSTVFSFQISRPRARGGLIWHPKSQKFISLTHGISSFSGGLSALIITPSSVVMQGPLKAAINVQERPIISNRSERSKEAPSCRSK